MPDAKRLEAIIRKLDGVCTEAELKVMLAQVDTEIDKARAGAAAIGLLETLNFTKGRIMGLLQAMGVIL
jgi:hypothetical protein